MTKKVTIIIPTFNGEKYIKTCLSSLLNQTYLNYEILVIDNHSQDQTIKIIEKEFPKVLVIKNKKNLGFAWAINIGIKKALENKAKILVLLNQDTEVQPNFLEEGVLILNSKEIGLASPVILYSNLNKIWWAGSKIYRGKEILKFHSLKIGEHIDKGKKYKKPNKDFFKTDWIPACALFVKKEVFKKIGLFDSNFFMYGEDIDFSLKAKRAGFKLFGFTKTIVFHNTQDYLKQNFSWETIKKGFWKAWARIKIVLRYFSLREKLFYFLKCLSLPFFFIFHESK